MCCRVPGPASCLIPTPTSYGRHRSACPPQAPMVRGSAASLALLAGAQGGQGQEQGRGMQSAGTVRGSPERWCFPCQQAALLPPAAPPSPPPQVLPAHWSTPFPPQHPWQMPLPTSHPSLRFGDEDIQCSSCCHWSLQLLTPSLLPPEGPCPSCPLALFGITVSPLCR